MASAFLDNPEGKSTVDHIDRIRHNNHVSNLRWYTRKEQASNVTRMRTRQAGRRPVYRTSPDGTVVWFGSLTEASIGLGGKTKDIIAAISMSCRKSIKTARGFVWDFVYDVDIDHEEDWKPIPMCKNMWASSKGRIKLETDKITFGGKQASGYLTVGVRRLDGTKYMGEVHRLICTTFHGNPPTKQHVVNHKDGDKHNNTPENLEWCTRRENVQHAVRTGLKVAKKNNKKSKPIIQYSLGGIRIAEFPSISEAKRTTGINNIGPACHGLRLHAGDYRWEFKDAKNK